MKRGKKPKGWTCVGDNRRCPLRRCPRVLKVTGTTVCYDEDPAPPPELRADMSVLLKPQPRCATTGFFFVRPDVWTKGEPDPFGFWFYWNEEQAFCPVDPRTSAMELPACWVPPKEKR